MTFDKALDKLAADPDHLYMKIPKCDYGLVLDKGMHNAYYVGMLRLKVAWPVPQVMMLSVDAYKTDEWIIKKR